MDIENKQEAINDIIEPLDNVFASVLDMKQASHSSRRSISEATYDDILRNINKAKNSIITLLYNKCFNTPVVKPPSFSDALKNPSPKNNLLIQLDDKKPTADAAAEAEKKIIDILKKTKTPATIINTSSTDKGNLVIKFKPKDNIQSIKTPLIETFGNKVKIHTSLVPKIKIVGVPSHFPTSNKDDVVASILSSNTFLAELNPGNIEYLFSYESKSGKTLILKCPPEVRKVIKNNNDMINIEYHQCRVFDRLHLSECTRCCGIGHTKQNCRSNVVHCTLCAENHSFTDCPVKNNEEKHVCYNCKISNDASIKNKGNNHRCFLDKCPIIVEAKKRLLQNTNWGIEPPVHLL